jgi:hypothetical protein
MPNNFCTLIASIAKQSKRHQQALDRLGSASLAMTICLAFE